MPVMVAGEMDQAVSTYTQLHSPSKSHFFTQIIDFDSKLVFAASCKRCSFLMLLFCGTCNSQFNEIDMNLF